MDRHSKPINCTGTPAVTQATKVYNAFKKMNNVDRTGTAVLLSHTRSNILSSSCLFAMNE